LALGKECESNRKKEKPKARTEGFSLAQIAFVSPMDRLRRVVGHLNPPSKRAQSFPAKALKKPDTVKSYELFKVPPRWVFLRVETDSGVVGWGEPNLEGFSDSVMACVKDLMSSVVGQDPSRIQYIWQKLFRQRFYGGAGGGIMMSAIAGYRCHFLANSRAISLIFTGFFAGFWPQFAGLTRRSGTFSERRTGCLCMRCWVGPYGSGC
jgi:hypothetical protein